MVGKQKDSVVEVIILSTLTTSLNTICFFSEMLYGREDS